MKLLMRSRSGAEAEVPVGGTHPSLDGWLQRGWSPVDTGAAPRAENAPEPGLIPLSGTPPIPPPVAPWTAGQDDVAPDVAYD